MNTVPFRPKLAPKPPQCWKAICQALQWNDRVCVATWATMLGNESDPYLRGTGASLLLLQERLHYLTYDYLAQAVKRHVTPRMLTRALELSVQNGTIKRRQASQLEDRILACVGAGGQWKA